MCRQTIRAHEIKMNQLLEKARGRRQVKWRKQEAVRVNKGRKKKRLEKKTSPEKDKRKEKNTSSNVIVPQRRKKCVNKNVRTTGIKKYNITTLQTKPRNTEFKRKEVNRGGKKTGSAGSPSVHVPQNCSLQSGWQEHSGHPGDLCPMA